MSRRCTAFLSAPAPANWKSRSTSYPSRHIRCAMSLFQEPKIDCHTHVIYPARFPYGRDIEYKPSGPEIGTTAQLRQVMKTYGVSHSLLVQPNSGYGSDNSCMFNAIARGEGRFKGIAIIDFDVDLTTL